MHRIFYSFYSISLHYLSAICQYQTVLIILTLVNSTKFINLKSLFQQLSMFNFPLSFVSTSFPLLFCYLVYLLTKYDNFLSVSLTGNNGSLNLINFFVITFYSYTSLIFWVSCFFFSLYFHHIWYYVVDMLVFNSKIF